MASAGFRESEERPVAQGEVIASTYAVREEITRVPTGIVYEARDLMLDRPVALKLAWRDPGTPTLILEARRCAAVHDPCAVAIYGMGSHNGMEFAVGERVTGQLLSSLVQGQPQLPPEQYLTKLRAIAAAVAHVHEAGVTVGEVSGETVLVDPGGRIILGRLSLSQVPAFGVHGHCLAPEVLRGDANIDEGPIATAIDLYGVGCTALEMACGMPAFSAEDRDGELHGHVYDAPPRLGDLRPDLPTELSDLVEWLLAKHPGDRPASAADVLAQIDALVERLGTKSRSVRILVVDDDTARARWLWSLARRAHASAVVEIASEGTDAAHKLNRDLPDLVFIDASLRGVMNALELCMYARGLEHDPSRATTRAQIVLVGQVAERERALFADVAVPSMPDDATLASSVLAHVRRIAAEPRRIRKVTTISG